MQTILTNNDNWKALSNDNNHRPVKNNEGGEAKKKEYTGSPEWQKVKKGDSI